MVISLSYLLSQSRWFIPSKPRCSQNIAWFWIFEPASTRVRSSPETFFLRHAERYNGQLRYESPFPSCAQFWHRQLEIHNNSKGKKQLTKTHQLVAASARRGCFMEPGVAQSAGLDRLITKCSITGTPVPKKVNTPAPLLLLQLQEDTLPSLNRGSPGNSANLWTHLEVCVKPRDDTDHTNPEVKWRQLFL